MESEQPAFLRNLVSVSQERELVRQEAQHLRDNNHRSEQAARLPTEGVPTALIFLFSEARKHVETFHDVHGHRIAAARDRAMFKVELFFENYEETPARRGRELYPSRKGNDGPSKPFPSLDCWEDTGRSIPSQHLCVLTQGETFATYGVTNSGGVLAEQETIL